MIGRHALRSPYPRRIAHLICSLVVLLGIAACGPASSSRPAGAGPARGPTGGPTVLGPTDPNRPLDITLTLVGQSPADLDRTLASVSDIHSPAYRHFLTPAQFGQRFGASPTTLARVAAALASAGFALGAPAGLQLPARGTARQVEAFFGVSLKDERAADGSVYYAPAGAPRLPDALQGRVTGVLGLDNRRVIRPRRRLRPAAGAQDGQGLTPTDLGHVYDLAPLKLDGSGQSIALAEIDTFKQSDIDAYDQRYSISASPVQVVTVGSGAFTPQDGSEATLDIEIAHAVAPKAHVIAYEGGSTFQGLAGTFGKAVADNRAHALSISLGICEPFVLHPDQAPNGTQDIFDESGTAFLTSLDNTFKQAAAQGMSVLVSSGDNGAYDCNAFDPANHVVATSVPADNPYVTAVGGTALFVGADGGYGHEAGWEDPLEGAGGGGGLSMHYPRPSWQTGPGTDNQFSNGMRQVPDVAANADQLTGYSVYDSSGHCSGGGCWTVVGGTSAAAPLWAATVLLGDQSAAGNGQAPLGFLNPALYSLGAGANGASSFHDITTGGNLYYPATTGWDFSTGWGTPDGSNVVRNLLALGRASG